MESSGSFTGSNLYVGSYNAGAQTAVINGTFVGDSVNITVVSFYLGSGSQLSVSSTAQSAPTGAGGHSGYAAGGGGHGGNGGAQAAGVAGIPYDSYIFPLMAGGAGAQSTITGINKFKLHYLYCNSNTWSTWWRSDINQCTRYHHY